MKVTYQTCCGVDVHKSFLIATIIKTTGSIEPSYQKKRFSTFNNSILEFKQWLLENDCRDVCMKPVNTGFLSLIFLKIKSTLSLPIPNGSKLLRVTKTTPRILNGSGIYSVSDLLKAAISPAK